MSATPSIRRGDPDGRRLARQRATLLAEAAAVIQAAKGLLTRASIDSDLLQQLLADLKVREHNELTRSYGRLDSRRRFKYHSGNPLRLNRPVSHLFIDENGKSRPEPRNLGRRYFSLGAIAMNDEDVDEYVQKADELKLKFFGSLKAGDTDEPLTFHEPFIRDGDRPYDFEGNKKKQAEFCDALNQLIEDTPFVVFGAGIRKWGFEDDFIRTGIDPYLPIDAYDTAITFVLERYVDYLATRPDQRTGRATLESIGPVEDAQHQLGATRLLLEGSQWVQPRSFRNWLEIGLRFLPKSGSHPLELADMFSRDLWEWIRDDCTGVPLRWELFSKKIYCREDGLRGKFGVKVFPDSDLRDRVLRHRENCGATVGR